MLKVLILFISLTFLPISFAKAADQPLRIIFLNVGQGDSILFIMPDGSTLLVDGGPDTRADWLIQNYISPYFCRVNVILSTHPDSDHVTGLNRVAEHCYIDMVFQNYVPKDTSIYTRWLKVSSKFENKELYAGSYFSMSDVNFYVLWPPRDLTVKATNDHSVSLFVDYNDFEALLTGDLENGVQDGLFENLKSLSDKIDRPLELYKASHHGAANGLHKPLILWLKPKAVVVSVGEKNTYGHPNEAVLDFFETVGSRIFRTDRDGTIEISVK